MLINDDVQRQMLQLLVKTTALPSPESEQRSAALLQLNPGQQVKGEIVANLTNHLYLARVAGELFKVELPLNVQPGESVPLTFVGAEPRVVFALRPQTGGEAVRLSSLGKWLSGAGQAETVRAPLLEGPPLQDASLLAARLKESLTNGGLFYEAHLSRWAAGALQLQELFEEPQGKLSPALRRRGEKAQPHEEHPVGDQRTLPLVKEQLAFVETRTLSWKAQAWPGQSFELAVTEEDEDALERFLEATLAVVLPHLGEVRTRVHLDGSGVALEIEAKNEASGEFLRAGLPDLVAASSARGLRLSRVVVRHEEETQ